MPYKLRKAPRKDLYWVVTIETGKKHSKDPIPKDKAEAQKRILEQALGKLAGAGHKSRLKEEYNRIMRNPRLTPQQRHDVKSIFDATNLKLTKLGKSNPILNRLVGIPANQQINSEKNKLVDTAIRTMDRIAPITLFQQRNPMSSEMTQGAVNLVDEYEERLANENPVNPISQTELEENPLSGQGMRGKAMPEGLDILQQIAKESYVLDNPKQDIGGWMLKKWTPTLKFYMKGNDVIVGVRGTIPTNSEDVSADLTIPFNGIPSTMRFKRDKASMQQFQQEYPTSQYSYYGVGHSLGGAVIDTMLRQGFIKEAVSYNPAIQYSDINGGLANRRIYYGSDPLYRLMGWWDKKSEHREPENRSWADWLGKYNPAAAAVAALPAHNLTNFEGGSKASGYVQRLIAEKKLIPEKVKNPSKYILAMKPKSKIENKIQKSVIEQCHRNLQVVEDLRQNSSNYTSNQESYYRMVIGMKECADKYKTYKFPYKSLKDLPSVMRRGFAAWYKKNTKLPILW